MNHDIEISWMVFCTGFVLVSAIVLLGGFFFGIHLARGLLGAWGVGL